MRYREIINEVGEATLLVDNLRRNLARAAQSGVSSTAEGIDAVVRLGYLGKHSPESIARSFGIMDPWDRLSDRAVGSYSPNEDKLRTVYRRLMDPSARLDTATTVAHELRHRAFTIISQLPELNSRMPSDLRSRWRDGYGDFNRGNYRYRPPELDKEISASPEHAMIYSVQDPDLANSWRRAFIQNPQLGGRSAEYWSNLYGQVNTAVRQYIETELQQDTSGELPGGELARPEDADRNFRLEPWVQEYYAAWDAIRGTDIRPRVQQLGLTVTLYKLQAILGDYRLNQPIIQRAKSVAQSLEQGHFRDIKTGVPAMIESSGEWQPTTIGTSTTTRSDFQETVRDLQKYYTAVDTLFESNWDQWDVRYYDGTFSRNLGKVVKRPTPAPVPVTPVTPPKNPQNPSNPPLPSPTTGTISFKQFAQSTPTPGSSNETLWQNIQNAPNQQSLNTWIFVTTAQATLVGLSVVPNTQKYIDQLMAAWDAMTPSNRRAVADVFLSQVMLTR